MSADNKNYTVCKHRDEVVVVMDMRTSNLVREALRNITLPYSIYDENLCRRMAYDLTNVMENQ